jgi:hypothetical protein
MKSVIKSVRILKLVNKVSNYTQIIAHKKGNRNLVTTDITKDDKNDARTAARTEDKEGK